MDYMFEKFFDDSASMTKEEAVIWLKTIRDEYSSTGNELGEELDSKLPNPIGLGLKRPSEIICGFTNKMKDALDMAIDVLGDGRNDCGGILEDRTLLSAACICDSRHDSMEEPCNGCPLSGITCEDSHAVIPRHWTYYKSKNKQGCKNYLHVGCLKYCEKYETYCGNRNGCSEADEHDAESRLP